MRVATAAPDGLHTHEDAEVLIDFGDAGVLSGRRDSPQSRPPSAAAPSRWSCVDRLESPITLHHTSKDRRGGGMKGSSSLWSRDSAFEQGFERECEPGGDRVGRCWFRHGGGWKRRLFKAAVAHLCGV